MNEMDRHFKLVAQAAVHLHPDHVGALALRLHLTSPRSRCRAADPAPTREMHEYLRRLSHGQDGLRLPALGNLRGRFPSERFLIVHYGDHHPMATRTLLGFDQMPTQRM